MSTFDIALVAHLLADWLFQNDWMAKNKSDLLHPAAWVHSGLHALMLGAALGWQGGVILGLLHILVDTRVPLHWWARVFRQTTEGSIGELVAMVSDQVLHIASIMVVMALLGLS